VKVGSGTTTDTPGSTTVDRIAWISSFDPLPTNTPSIGQPVASDTAPIKSWATKGGYRFHGRSANRSHNDALSSAGTSYGLSFWLSLIGGSWCRSVYAPSCRTRDLM